MESHKRIVSLLIGAVVVLSGCSSSPDTSTAPGSPTGGQPAHVTVKMLDSSFQPASLIVSAGSSVTFDLPNVGVLPHNMHIASERGVYRESPWMSETITGGKKTSLVWEVPEAPGRYRFRCDVHEAVMVGTITVQ